MTQQQGIRLVTDDQLELLIFAFIDDCELVGLSSETVSFYQRKLPKFLWWARETGRPLDPTDYTPNDIRDFLRYVQTAPVRWGSEHPNASKPINPGGVDAYYRSLKRFWNWLVEQEFIDRSPMDKRLRRPRNPKRYIEPFSEEELTVIANQLRQAEDTELVARDRAIVAVLLDVGLRSSELCNMLIRDVDVMSGRVTVQHGKGDKRRSVRLGSGAKAAVRRYWVRHRSKAAATIDEPLFINARGQSLTTSGLHQLLRRIANRVGVQDVHPHRFRHTFAINALRAGMGLLELQTMLGHESLEMVRHYARIAETDLDRAARDHSPLDRMKLGL